MQTALRRMMVLIAILAAILTAAVPHQHGAGDLTESVFGEHLEVTGACDEQVSHFHAASRTHQHPCVACTRQHQQGLVFVDRFTAPIVHLTPVAAFASAIVESPDSLATPSRAPPALS